MYPELLPLIRTPRLPAVDWTDAPADLNGLVRFAERRNLVSARVPSHFNWPLQGFLISRVAHRIGLTHSTRRHNPKSQNIIYVKKLRQQMSPAKGSRISQPSFLLVSWLAWSGNAGVSSDSANGCTNCTHKLPSALQGSVPIERHKLWFNSTKKTEHYVLFSFY